ncbi:SDR family NAD(P)-dependent oxidoreductase [Devosia sp. SL43]|uniref:SDR family NAD(P)-dependent oxidoreductase n=1 Tax=Devosia sp. SL43 TaxID=2806348 RepID=UPI001F32C82D|nr:SDR family oxidoreductase [Devosia sp. SL43]UJW85018.1 SDR family oxidoreductase [Devosia sp. SL43]
MAYSFKDKIALVTGAASGIGAAVAQLLAASGAKVMIADLDAEGASSVAESILAQGGVAKAIEVDVTDAVEVEAMVDATRRQYGGLHLAVNNAGIAGASAPTGEYPLESWRKVMATNLDSVFYGMRYQIPAIQASGGGAIVNMASILGSVAFANAPAYVAAKHGMVGLTKTAAIEYARHGIRINSIGPGFIDTPLLSKNLDAATLTAIAGMHPVGRLGTASEVATLTAFLLSDDASFITGSYHLVDGGYTAQ